MQFTPRIISTLPYHDIMCSTFKLKQVRYRDMSIFNRTFHPDEANQAFTTGRLLETGVYRYDPKDHHGPTLYYAAAAVQKAAGIGVKPSFYLAHTKSFQVVCRVCGK